MSITTDAADFVRRQAVLYEGFVKTAAELDRIGSMEQATIEAQAAWDKVEASKLTAQGELDAINAQIAQARDLAPSILSEATVAATSQAADIVMQANERAQSIIAAATAQADDARARTLAERAVAQDDLSAVRMQAAGLRDAVGVAQMQVDTAQAEYDRLTKAVEALKKQFA